MIKRVVYIAVLLLLTSTGAHAQRTLSSVGYDLRDTGADMLHIFTSPFHASASDWMGAAGALGLAMLALPIDDNVDRWVVANPNSALARNNFFRENRRFNLGDLGTGKRLQPILGIVYVAGFATNSRALRDAALGCSGVQVASSAIRKGVVYPLVARPRPDSAIAMGMNQYDIDVPGGSWAFHSFPAGHFMNAIGCASFLGSRFKMGIAEPLVYAAAAGIGLARIADRRHWTSDTMLSMVAGYAIGRTVAARQLNRHNRAPSLGAASLQGEPRYVMSWNITF